jgi:hypothetical protein
MTLDTSSLLTHPKITESRKLMDTSRIITFQHVNTVVNDPIYIAFFCYVSGIAEYDAMGIKPCRIKVSDPAKSETSWNMIPGSHVG